MNTDKLLDLKHQIEENLPYLQEKQPISPLIAQSIEILFDMQASEDEIHSWVQIQKKFIRDIERELVKLQTSQAV